MGWLSVAPERRFVGQPTRIWVLQEYLYGGARRSAIQCLVDPGNPHLKARILIADDHDGTRGILRVLLQQHAGWEVCGEASTGEETLKNAWS